MNHVSLIGRMEGHPVAGTMNGGKGCARFRLITQQSVIDGQGKRRETKQKHDLYAWGKWHQLLNEVGQPDLKVAVEGKLVNRYVRWKGQLLKITEIEVNDLVLM